MIKGLCNFIYQLSEVTYHSSAGNISTIYMKKKVVIIDDDELIASVLKKLISLYPTLEFVGHCKSFSEAQQFFETEIVDIILLDVELADGKGFDLMPFISGEPSIIIITSNEDYAFTAFEIGAIDFLKKPILPARFKKTIDKIMERSEAVTNSESIAIPDRNKSFLFVKSGVKIIKIDISQLLYAEALRDYIKLVLVNKEAHLINLSLAELSKKLSNHGFIQIHRSYIISISQIKQVHDDTAYLPGAEIPIGKTYKSAINELLK